MDTVENIHKHIILWFIHGSHVYGTNSETSDKDFTFIVDDDVDLSKYPNGVFEVINSSYKEDYQYINHSTFIKDIHNHEVYALESLWMDPSMYSDYEKFQNLYAKEFSLDKWQLRQKISKLCNNSWAKAHKKLTVEKDFDLYRGLKSLFHCLRIYMFGEQIASNGKIIDYSSANFLWKEICEMNTSDWEVYKQKYQSVFNSYRSKLALVCPKPIEK